MTIKSIAANTAQIIKPLLNDIAKNVVNIWGFIGGETLDMSGKEVGEFKTELQSRIKGYDSLIVRAAAIGRYMVSAKVSEAFMSKAYRALGERIIGNVCQQKVDDLADITAALKLGIDSGLLDTRNIGEFKKTWKDSGLKIAISDIKKNPTPEKGNKGNGGGGEDTANKLIKAEKNLEASRRNHNETKLTLAKVKGEVSATQKRNNALAAAIDRIASLAADPKFPAKKLRGECLELRAFITQTETVAADPVDRDAAKLQRFAAKSKKAAAANKGIARKKAKEAAAAK